MDWGSIILGIVSALFGGGIGAYWTFRISSRKEDTNEFKVLLEERKAITSELRDRVSQLENEVIKLRNEREEDKEEIRTLRHQLVVFESSHVDIPLAMWMKDTDGKMVFLNSIYEELFLSPRGYSMNDYLGKNDYAVWPNEIAKAFMANDKKVIRTKKHQTVIEELVDNDGGKCYVEVIKYPRKLNNVVIGISGIVIRKSKNRKELE